MTWSKKTQAEQNHTSQGVVWLCIWGLAWGPHIIRAHILHSTDGPVFTSQFSCLVIRSLHNSSPVLLVLSPPPPPSLLLPLPVTWNFIPAFYFQLFFSNNLRESRCKRPGVGVGVLSAVLVPLRTGFWLPFFPAPAHNLFYFVLGALFFIDAFSKFL